MGRASAALRRARRLPLRNVLELCTRDLEDFLGSASRGDDLTIVAVRRNTAVH